MGGKSGRAGKQILFYVAPFLMFLSGGCALHDTQEKTFSAHLVKGEQKAAYGILETSDKVIDDKALFGYVLLFADRNGEYYNSHMATVYMNRLRTIYPESPYTGYAVQTVKIMEQAEAAEKESAELKNKLAESRKALTEQTAANGVLSESVKTLEDSANRLTGENKELNDRLKALGRENEQFRHQLEKMKEVDLNVGRKGIGN